MEAVTDATHYGGKQLVAVMEATRYGGKELKTMTYTGR